MTGEFTLCLRVLNSLKEMALYFAVVQFLIPILLDKIYLYYLMISMGPAHWRSPDAHSDVVTIRIYIYTYSMYVHIYDYIYACLIYKYSCSAVYVSMVQLELMT